MFKSNTVYKLKDPIRYDDEFGIGYDRIETFGECDGMYITECWIVNQLGEVHPGYADCPVPIRFDDVEEEAIQDPSNQERKRSSGMWR